MLLSGAAIHKQLPLYLGVVTCCALPLTLTGTICSIVGVLRPGRTYWLSIVGIVLGALLILGMIPGAVIMLKQNT
jgi:hypothetical protein